MRACFSIRFVGRNIGEHHGQVLLGLASRHTSGCLGDRLFLLPLGTLMEIDSTPDTAGLNAPKLVDKAADAASGAIRSTQGVANERWIAWRTTSKAPAINSNRRWIACPTGRSADSAQHRCGARKFRATARQGGTSFRHDGWPYQGRTTQGRAHCRGHWRRTDGIGGSYQPLK